MSRAARALDAALELAVVPSFTRIGPALRSRVEHWHPLSSYDLTGRTVLVTGATSGLGRHAARRFAELGAEVVVNGRDPDRTRTACDEIADLTGSQKVHAVVADMAEPEQVARLAGEVRERWPVLHALVHNAGALSHDRTTTSAGIETTVAAQVLGPFLLTTLLLPSLRAAAPGRVVTVASGGMYTAPLDVGGIEMDAGAYRGSEQYARAKRAQVTLNELWADHVPPSEIVFHAMHPGWADTPGVRASLPTFRTITRPLLRDVEQGADTTVWLVADDTATASTGGFWLDRRRRATHRLGRTRASDTADERRRLWDWCLARTAGWSEAS